jgi:hypothetical protein
MPVGPQKRTSDALVPVPLAKKTRNELISYSHKDKALLEQTVRNVYFNTFYNIHVFV